MMGKPLSIGVLANRSIESCKQTWLPTADYLTAAIPEFKFLIIPLSFQVIKNAVAENEVDFIIANPSLYVEFEFRYGINRIATLKRLYQGQPYTQFGGVIFCHQADPIETLTDLRGQHFMAVSEHAFGGWRAAYREILDAGLNPYHDFSSLRFGGTHDAVVQAVQHGEICAGTVATDVLESMALEGKIQLQDFRILNRKTCPDFPFALSTRLYPEWPFAVAQHVDASLAEQVAILLLQLPQESTAAKAAKAVGWTIPLNYQPIHECFQALQVHPYKDFGKTNSSFTLAVRGSSDGLWDWNLETGEVFFSDRWKEMLGYEPHELDNRLNVWHERIHPGDRETVLSSFQSYFNGTAIAYEYEYRLRHRQGDYLWILCRAKLLRDVQGRPYRMAGSHSDITKRKRVEEDLRQSEIHLKQKTQQLEQTLSELQQIQLQVIHTEKMAALYQLVAGIAHEINIALFACVRYRTHLIKKTSEFIPAPHSTECRYNPVSFILGNISFLDQYISDLLKLIALYQQTYPQPVGSIQSAIAEIELDFLIPDLANLTQSIRTGADRIKSIVQLLRNFSHLDEAEIKVVNIHEGIDNTISLLRYRLTMGARHHSIQIVKEYGDLPLVECYSSQLNQVFLNLITNAIDALEDTFLTQDIQSPSYHVPAPQITVRTQMIDPSQVRIEVSDNGSGISDERIQQRIFDPFFTTKPIGKGTGMGLAISYHIVVRQHGGKLACRPNGERGMTFTVEIPIHQMPAPSRNSSIN